MVPSALVRGVDPVEVEGAGRGTGTEGLGVRDGVSGIDAEDVDGFRDGG